MSNCNSCNASSLGDEFSASAPSAEAVFYRSYSRRSETGRESFDAAIERTVGAIAEIGGLTEGEKQLCLRLGKEQLVFPSGRALWVAGTEWGKKPENFPGYYNCCSMEVDDVEVFGTLMDLAMQGTGTGAVLESAQINKLPPVFYSLNLLEVKPIGEEGGADQTTVLGNAYADDVLTLIVGDSRQGWRDAYMQLIKWSMGMMVNSRDSSKDLILDLSQVRPAGKKLKGFGGKSNPARLEKTFRRIIAILNEVNSRPDRKIKPIDACLIIDEAASAVVAGNIRRSAGMRQFSAEDHDASTAKEHLYRQDEDGNWSVDPEREALRMANHTRCFHHKPSYEEIHQAVTKQFYSGEGAIQYVPEAIARANADILKNKTKRKEFIRAYENGAGRGEACIARTGKIRGGDKELKHRMERYGLNPCGEIIMKDNLCNLAEVHLNNLDPSDISAQRDAFSTAGLQCAALLNHKFTVEKLQYSREIDPIVGVSFTGLFDFFVLAFGVDWLSWMMNGRPLDSRAGKYFTEAETTYLERWKKAAEQGVKRYCRHHGIRTPNRFTTVQPAGTKSLLTGASPGWHPPKAQRFIRRITFGVDDPLVSALRDWGYSVIPAQSARDENGNLLDDIDDPRVQEVLVEIPTEVPWANLPGCDQFDLSKLPVKSQFGLYMQVQTHYTTHNTSATLEFREEEIDELSHLIHDAISNDRGYISAALLARFDANETFPRLPFEPISKDDYNKLMLVVRILRQAQIEAGFTFRSLLAKYDNPEYELQGAAGCDSDKCLSSNTKDRDQVGMKI
jgi:ribonucleotide reductase class II